MLNAFRYHWFDVGVLLAAILGASLFYAQPKGMTLVMWLSLGSLFLHQAEEWRYPGYFPAFVNAVMFKSDMPDRYPLNANSGMMINVILGWGVYFLAALYWERMPWLAIATMVVSVGNILFHTVLLNIKGKTLYNPGLVTCWLCFVPVVCGFLILASGDHFVSGADWLWGIAIGLCLNYFGVYKAIIWLANQQSSYVLPTTFMAKANLQHVNH